MGTEAAQCTHTAVHSRPKAMLDTLRPVRDTIIIKGPWHLRTPLMLRTSTALVIFECKWVLHAVGLSHERVLPRVIAPVLYTVHFFLI